MANIHNLYIVKGEDGSVVNAVQPYDLSTIVGGQEVPKQVEAKYVVNNGDGTFSEYTYPAKGSKYLTKVTNQATGDYAYLDGKTGQISSLLTNPSCSVCNDDARGTVTIDSSCEKPLFVSVCDYTANDRELIFTEAESVCVTNGSTSNTYLVRERIVWDSVTYTEVSRVTEYSADGLSWSTTAPTGTIKLGACEVPFTCNSSISEAFGNDLSTLLPSNNFSITKPSCCKILVETSIGNFHVIDGIQFYNTSDFKCDVTINNVTIVSGSCTLDKVHIIGNKL